MKAKFFSIFLILIISGFFLCEQSNVLWTNGILNTCHKMQLRSLEDDLQCYKGILKDCWSQIEKRDKAAESIFTRNMELYRSIGLDYSERKYRAEEETMDIINQLELLFLTFINFENKKKAQLEMSLTDQ